jgi:hypothetical protein
MKYVTIKEQIEHGLNSIDKNRTIEISLKDLMLMFKTMEEFNRFFHQSSHYQDSVQIHDYMDSEKGGAYEMIHKLYYDVLWNYLPEDIQKQIENGGEPFESPIKPFYFNEKSDSKK